MTWDAIAAVAELVGAAGVILSLVYLAGQVRSSGSQARHAAIQSVVNKMNELWNTMASASTADLWTRGSKGLDQLEGESERVQFSALMLSMLRPYEEVYHYRRDGLVDDWTWESISTVCHALMGTPGWWEWWTLRGGWFSSEFQAHIREVQTEGAEYERLEDHTSSNVHHPQRTRA